MSWAKGDEVSERMAIAQLYELGLGRQDELAKIFQTHVNTIAKYINTFKANGASGLITQTRGPKESWKLTPQVRAKILIIALEEGIREYAAIQKRLKEYWNTEVSIPGLREVLIENGFVKESISTEVPKTKQGELFDDQPKRQLEFSNFRKNINVEEIPATKEIEKYPETIHPERRLRSDYSQSQRIYLDQLEQGVYNTYAGGLLFVPLLKEYNFLPIIKKIINIETYEGYNLDELCLSLFYFDLFRFESMENFKTAYPEEMGQLFGRISKSKRIKTRKGQA